MDVAPSITVSEMRQQLAVDLGLNVNEMCLMLGDVELEPQKTLQDYVNVSEQTLRLVSLKQGKNVADDDLQHSDFEKLSPLPVVHRDSTTDSHLKVEPNPISSRTDSQDQEDNLMYM